MRYKNPGSALIACLALVVLLAGCKQKEDPSPGAVKLTLRHTLQGQPVRIGSFQTVNDSEQIQINEFKYYLSNFRLISSGSKAWNEPESYHLVDVAAGGGVATVVLPNVPQRSYTGLEFFFGVDNSRNTSVDWQGDLDPKYGMAWDWVTGYRFMKLEGRCKNGSLEKPLVWHVGFDGNFRKLSRTLAAAEARNGDTLRLEFTCALDSLFLAPHHLLPLTRFNNQMGSLDTTGKIADNFAQGFIKLKL